MTSAFVRKTSVTVAVLVLGCLPHGVATREGAGARAGDDGPEERGTRVAGACAAQAVQRLPRRRLRRRRHAVVLHDQHDGHRRQGARRRPAAAARHLHVERLLRRPRSLDGQAVLPLQQPDRARLHLGRLLERSQGARKRRSENGSMGPLRSRLSTRSHRQPVSIQDRARALRSAARRDEGARRSDRAHKGHACPTGTAATPGT